jgi:hypothetical protein
MVRWALFDRSGEDGDQDDDGQGYAEKEQQK